MTEQNYHPDPRAKPLRDYPSLHLGAGSSTASGVLSDGLVDPVAAPSDPSVTNRYTNTATGTEWVWAAGQAAPPWIQVV